MVKAVALGTVNVCRKPGVRATKLDPAVPAQIETKAPGSVFDLEQKQFDELAMLGAVRQATKADLASSDDAAKPDPAAVAGAQKAVSEAEVALKDASTPAAKAEAEEKLKTAKAALAVILGS